MPDVAVVVLNQNGRHLLPECLASLHRLTTPVELVVADNGSTDGSLTFLRAEHPDVRVVEHGRNLGFAGGYNEALAQVERPWVVLLNNDATLAPDWVERLLAFAAEHPRAAILGGKLLFANRLQDGKPVVQSAGASFTTAGTAFEIGWGETDAGQYDEPRPSGSIPGAALLMQRSVFFELGGFDPAYVIYLEDVDLCWRAWLRGYEVWYVPQARAHHQYGAWSGGRLSPFRIRQMQRNRLTNLARNLQARSWPGAAAVSSAYDAYRMLEYGRQGQWAAARALAAGTLAFWRDAGKVLARRRQVQRTRVLSDRDLRERGLLVPALAAWREYRRLGKLA